MSKTAFLIIMIINYTFDVFLSIFTLCCLVLQLFILLVPCIGSYKSEAPDGVVLVWFAPYEILFHQMLFIGR